MNTQKNIVEVKGLSKIYKQDDQEVKALDNVSLSVHKGEFVAVVGKSGSGKSTFLHMIGGLDDATSGAVMICGKEIFQMKQKELTEFRRERIGFIFQSYNLLPVLNVYDNIIFPLELAKRKVDREFVDAIIKVLGIEEKKNYMPSQLSGGQQQRVAIARALAMKPMIILADEPTGNLDSKNTEQVIKLLRMTAKKLGQTVILITHDQEIASFCERTITLEDGKLVNDTKVD